jgi:hypothetical protein
MIIVTTDRQGNKWFIAFYGAGKRMLSETTQAMRRQGREWGMVRHGDVYTVFAKHEPEKTNLSLYERRR